MITNTTVGYIYLSQNRYSLKRQQHNVVDYAEDKNDYIFDEVYNEGR